MALLFPFVWVAVPVQQVQPEQRAAFEAGRVVRPVGWDFICSDHRDDTQHAPDVRTNKSPNQTPVPTTSWFVNQLRAQLVVVPTNKLLVLKCVETSRSSGSQSEPLWKPTTSCC